MCSYYLNYLESLFIHNIKNAGQLVVKICMLTAAKESLKEYLKNT
jgi:hypothetical protein